MAARPRVSNSDSNKLYPEDRAVHDWYRFVLSFPPHLVREYLTRFGVGAGSRVLDPFCGTGTVLVECKKLGIPSVGVEANPVAHFASTVKDDWTPDPDELLTHARMISESARADFTSAGTPDRTLFEGVSGYDLRSLPAELNDLLLKDSVSPLPLHKTLTILDLFEQNRDSRFYNHERLALASALVSSFSNLEFGPEVGVGPPKSDVAAGSIWLGRVESMANDLRHMQKRQETDARVYLADARCVEDVVEPNSIDAVIMSPPYPNEKDYTRTTRLESVLLGFIRDKESLRALKRGLVRSNTRGVYRQDDDDRWLESHPEIQRIARAIEERRIELGKTSGFERLYARVTKLYFGGMARHLAGLRAVLRPSARLAYVVGDQASYLRVMIRTGAILADIATSLGYEVESIDLFRTRLATAPSFSRFG